MSDTDRRFKALTAENWLEPDPTGDAFGEIHLGTGDRRPMSGDRWVEHFLRVELSADVPGDVRDMWSIARGVLLYGWFFYPLYALGDAELIFMALPHGESAALAERLPRARIVDLSAAERAAADFLAALGIELDGEELRETPGRMARAYAELFEPRPLRMTPFPTTEG